MSDILSLVTSDSSTISLQQVNMPNNNSTSLLAIVTCYYPIVTVLSSATELLNIYLILISSKTLKYITEKLIFRILYAFIAFWTVINRPP